jgi:hypothetical protein
MLVGEARKRGAGVAAAAIERHRAGAAWSPAMRAGSDLHAWWTDLAAHAAGRRTLINNGGHAYPLPR